MSKGRSADFVGGCHGTVARLSSCLWLRHGCLPPFVGGLGFLWKPAEKMAHMESVMEVVNAGML